MDQRHPYRAPAEREDDRSTSPFEYLERLPSDPSALAELVARVPPYAKIDDAVAVSVVERLIRQSSPLELAWLNARWRTTRISRIAKGVPISNEQIRADGLAWIGTSVERMALASFHWSGFVREPAVHLLAAQADGFELPFLLLRANDWTANVHRTATAAISKRITVAYAVHWAKAIALLELLSECWSYRGDLVRLRTQIRELLVSPAARAALRTAFVSGEQAARRACLTLICALPKAESEAMLFEGLRDRDPLIASRSAHALLEHAEGERLVRFLERALHHPLVKVRGFALQAAQQLEPQAKVALFREALLDRERSLREIARHEISKSADDPIDFVSFYRECLRTRQGRTWTAALEGLAELAGEEDAPLFRAWLHDPRADVRAAAIVGLSRTARSSPLDELTEALADRSSRVRRAAQPYARRYMGRTVVQPRQH